MDLKTKDVKKCKPLVNEIVHLDVNSGVQIHSDFDFLIKILEDSSRQGY